MVEFKSCISLNPSPVINKFNRILFLLYKHVLKFNLSQIIDAVCQPRTLGHYFLLAMHHWFICFLKCKAELRTVETSHEKERFYE